MSTIDLFAGPGGWDTGVLPLGLRPLGIEWDETACETARAAGHERLQADIAELTPSDHADSALDGLIASPPCQGFSMAGKGLGRQDSEKICVAARAMGRGNDEQILSTLRQHGWIKDKRSTLALEPLRWALHLEPEWMCWEQVPAVLPLWEVCADVLREDGYSVWTGNVQAEQYGVPQTRKRAILIASRNRQVARPTPTHSQFYPRNRGKLDMGVAKWVSMAEALAPLGWLPGDLVGFPRLADTADVVTIDGQDYRARDLRSADLPAFALTEKARSWQRWQYVNGNQAHSCRRDLDEPAPTVHFAQRMNLVEWQPVVAVPGDTSWVFERPSPTIVGSFHPDVVAAPGYRKAGDPPRQKTPGSVRVTVEEAACLQAFPTLYPWAGSRTAQYRQVGDAVPPRLALHVAAEATGLAIPTAGEVAA